MNATIARPAGGEFPATVFAIPIANMQSEAIADPNSIEVLLPITLVVKYRPIKTPAKLPQVEIIDAWKGLSIPAIWKKNV